MITAEETMQRLVRLFLACNAAQPTFRFSQGKDAVILTNACSSIVKKIAEQEDSILSLGAEGLTIQYFKR